MSGQQVDLNTWTITSFEVEIERPIGYGGFGQVYQGTWNRTRVALKVLRSEDGVTPSPESIHREISVSLPQQRNFVNLVTMQYRFG